jgi:hypothetical protein
VDTTVNFQFDVAFSGFERKHLIYGSGACQSQGRG